MAQKRRKKKSGLKPVYIARRMVLAVICVAIVGVAAWCLWPADEEQPAEEVAASPKEPVSEADAQAASRQSEEEPEPETKSQPEPESTSEPEAKPEPELPLAEPGDWSLILANSTSPLPDGYAPPEIETIEGYRMDKRIAPNVVRMFTKAREDGVSLMICSGYRPFEKQQELFTNQVQYYLNKGYDEQKADAMTVSMIARPGTSEHQTGLALDIVTPNYQTLDEGFAETAAFKWLAQNAHKYGFVLRYPKDKQGITQIIYEPWHYRYVGIEHAAKIKEAGICLEEYLEQTTKEPEPQAESVDEPIEAESTQEKT